MITLKHSRNITSFLIIFFLSNSAIGLSERAKIALATGASMVTLGSVFFYKHLQSKKIHSCIVRIESSCKNMEESYCSQLILLENKSEVLPLVVLDNLAQSLKSTHVHDYLSVLAVQVELLKADIDEVQKNKREAKKHNHLLLSAQKLVSKLIVLYSFIAKEQDYFLKHTYSDRQCIVRGQKRIQEIKSSYGTLLDILDYTKSAEKLDEQELIQINNHLFVLNTEKNNFISCLSCTLENIIKEIDFIDNHASDWQQESPLCLQAQELKPLYLELKAKLTCLTCIIAAHDSYFALNYMYTNCLSHYAKVEALNELILKQEWPELIHEMILDAYPQSSVIYPYICYADTLFQKMLSLEKAIEELKRNCASHEALFQRSDNLLTKLTLLSKKITQSAEFQRQKEAQQESLRAKESIEVQRQAALAQHEQNLLERERLRQKEARIKELDRANSISEQQNIIKAKKNDLKATILQESRPQGALLIELRALLRKIDESSENKLAESELNRIISELQFIQHQLIKAGISFAH